MKFYWKLGYLFRFSKIGNHVYNIYSLIVIYITGYVDFFPNISIIHEYGSFRHLILLLATQLISN